MEQENGITVDMKRKTIMGMMQDHRKILLEIFHLAEEIKSAIGPMDNGEATPHEEQKCIFAEVDMQTEIMRGIHLILRDVRGLLM